MAIHIGSNKVGKVYLGNNQIDKVYLGAQLIWQSFISVGAKPSYSTITRTYNGTAQTNGYTTPSVGVTVTGNTSGTNAGTYTATYTIQEGYCWSDGTTDTCTITMTMAKGAGAISTAPANKNETQLTYYTVSHELCTAAAGTGTIYYSTDGTNFSTTIPSTKTASTSAYTVYYYAAESDNYNQSSTYTIQCYLHPDYLCFTANTAGSTIYIPFSCMSSTDRQTWTNCEYETITLPSVGSKLYLRNYNTLPIANTEFVMSGSIAASGNMMSILDSSCQSTSMQSYAFIGLFRNCTSLTSAPALPALTLSEQCYFDMFYGCTSLAAAPKLPAQTLQLQCYQGMFFQCSALTTAPTLPALTLADGCYRYMFYGCSSLYVSDSSGSSYSKPWYIPSGNSGSGDYTMSYMFYSCLGTRSTDSPNFNGTRKVYYTQNQPVGNLTSGNFSCTSTYSSGGTYTGTVTYVPAAILSANKGKTIRMSYDTYSMGDFTCSTTPSDWQYKRFGIHGSLYINGSVQYPLTEILLCGHEGWAYCEWTIPSSFSTITDLQSNIQVTYSSGYAKPASTNPSTWYIRNVVVEFV